MSKEESYKVFINGKGIDCTEHQVMVPCLLIRTVKDEIWFYPWDTIQHVRIEAKMIKIVEKRAQEMQAQGPAQSDIVVPPRDMILPFDPSERRPS